MKKTLAERGLFKEKVHSALYQNEDIRNMIFDGLPPSNTKESMMRFKEHVKSHLFFEDTITEAGTYIFYDVAFPKIGTTTKKCTMVMYLMAHRDVQDTYSLNGYHGNRIDILAELVENTLLNDQKTARSFGIGEIHLDKVRIYNATRFYGCVLEFSVPDFR